MDFMDKINIKNRKREKVVVLVDETKKAKGLTFVMHGLSGNKEQLHIVTMAEAFKENSYTVIRFDTTNTFGESDGKYEDATVTNYYEDLEDVINWSQTQKWYQEPFVLVGHSLGGICVALYAEKFPEKVKALAPISTVVSGKISGEAHGKEILDKWKKIGWLEEVSAGRQGLIKRLKWSHYLDRLRHDLLPDVNKLTMPVLMVVGKNDDKTPLKHQEILFDKLLGKKELHIIKNAPHSFREKEHLEELKKIFDKWLKSLDLKTIFL